MSSIEYIQLLNKYAFSTLDTLSVGGGVQTFGVIIDVNPIKQSIGGDKDYYLNVKLIDPTIERGYVTALIFQENQQDLPNIQIDDIIMFRNVIVNEFNGRQIESNQRKSSVFLFKDQNINHYEVSYQEAEIIQFLKSWSLKSRQEMMPIVVSKGRPLLETQQFLNHPSKFFDYVGVVVNYKPKSHLPGAQPNAMLLLSDYTINPLPPAAESYDNLNIGNDRLIFCTLWDNHADNCPDLQPGDFVHLKNCMRKLKNVLEINIKGNNEAKILVKKLHKTDPLLLKLVERQSQQGCVRRLRSITLQDLGKSLTFEEIILKEDVGTFSTFGFVRDYKPRDLKEWICGLCSPCFVSVPPGQPCSNCGKATKIMYKFCLLIGDTADLALKVYGFDFADQLFDGITAQRAHDDPAAFSKLEKMVQLLCCGEEKFFFSFSVQSYFVDPTRPFYNYQIWNTRLVLEE